MTGHPGDDGTAEAETAVEVAPFESLGSYKCPETPTEDRLREGWARLKLLVREEESEPFVADDTLRETAGTTLDEMAPAPACRPLVLEAEHEFQDWATAESMSDRIQVVVMPPCEEKSILEIWGQEQGFEILDSPSREELARERSGGPSGHEPAPTEGALAGDGVLVIPRLERWFLRCSGGLEAVRALLRDILASERRVVVGCSSWAWAFLCKAVDLQMLLPEPKTFQPFDQARLQAWFSELAASDEGSGYRFRFSENGAMMEIGPAQEADSKKQGSGSSNESATTAYFERLAARSRGIPWVAWHLWRSGIRSRSSDAPEVSEADFGSDLSTLWITALSENKLQGTQNPEELLVLQALLIHGQLTRGELHHVLPTMQFMSVVQALDSAGLVEFKGEQLQCMPLAYPAIRLALQGGGFPLDPL